MDATTLQPTPHPTAPLTFPSTAMPSTLSFDFQLPTPGPTAPAEATSMTQPFIFNTNAATTTPVASTSDTPMGTFSLESSFGAFSMGREMNAVPSRVPRSVREAQEAARIQADEQATKPVLNATPSATAFTLDPSNPFIAPSSKEFASPAKEQNDVTPPTQVPPPIPSAKQTAPSSADSLPFPPPPLSIDLTRQYAPLLNPEQKMLDMIESSCKSTFSNTSFSSILQKIKQHFFHRQFEAVFANPAHLQVYVAQYLPMRALCYHALWSSNPILRKLLEKDITIYCIGAGPGSELVGISMARECSIRQRIKEQKLTLSQVLPTPSSTTPVAPKFRIHTQDLFDWTPSLHSLLTELRHASPISYASTSFTFSQSNITNPGLKMIPFHNSHLITMMFVINELFQENKKLAMDFVARLVEAMRPGAFLLVADSAGDFSHLEIGGGGGKKPDQQAGGEDEQGGGAADASRGAMIEEDDDEEQEQASSASSSSASSSSSSTASSRPSKPRRTYMVYTILDHIPALTCLHKNDSVWYRYPEKEKQLKYPLKFENMRYFIRIYQKKKL